MRLVEVLTAAMPDAQDLDSLALNREQDAVEMRLLSINQLPHFEGDGHVLGSQLTTFGKIRLGKRLPLPASETSEAQPHLHVRKEATPKLRLRLSWLSGLLQRGRPCFTRNSSRKLSAG
jgi:hypothetical protein